MYKKKEIILSSKESLANYIDGFDIYNSTLLYEMNDPYLPRENYEITVYEYRPDLIARDFYGSEKYTDLLFIQCAKTLSDFKKGTVLSLIPKKILDEILKKM